MKLCRHSLIPLLLALLLQESVAQTSVTQTVMEGVYETVRTPYKYGVVLSGQAGQMVDSPSVYFHGDRWYMVYIVFDGNGYETEIAESTNLLHWTKTGKILDYGPPDSWDRNQAAGYIALQDHQWAGTYGLHTHDSKYWLSYLGGSTSGYEAGELGIGIASVTNPTQTTPWTRMSTNAVLSPSDADARAFEDDKLYKSHIIRDQSESLGFPYVMYYNAKGGHESIGMAVSDDMVNWQRYGDGPVVDHGSGITGDPQISRIGDVWVMFYFGAFWAPGAFDTFAASYDLVNWTKWDGAKLIESSEPYDSTYAHKPWVVVHEGVVYHFYNAVGSEGRVIALATSEDLSQPPEPGIGLVAHWEFDNAGDVGEATVGSNLVVVGDATYSASGKIGGALSLDGTGDYLRVDGSHTLSADLPTGDASFTIAAFIQTTANTRNTIAFWGNSSTAQANGFRTTAVGEAGIADNGTGGLLDFGWGGSYDYGVGAGGTPPGTIYDGQWHHVAVTYDSTASIKRLYFDGVELGTGKVISDLNVAAANFGIGSRTGNDDFTGLMDDVRVYDTALSGLEIAALAAGPVVTQGTLIYGR
ncbi:MAG: hypothetical protein HN919_21785 [Verrucomicrobia bacterium]|jgi:predicted GH43/DUF377 family glycosyl hydrolase|nr:hypothetical protein [Verrucomicrobiota bacterium]MBT7068943.1 hypothetical protein [Verrucomicrobiota bacterium]